MNNATIKKAKHIWPSLALGAVVIVSMSLSSAVFSQSGYPPPTSLIAETQAVGSGQIKLSWQKTSSSEVIGYNIYRDGAYFDYVIGANTLSYYDTNLPPSTSFDYFVKAVYLGVAEAALPVSNTVSAVSPAYCTRGASECVSLNPFTAGPGRTIVDLKGKKLDANRKQSETFTVNLPAGRYQVYARSFDAYPNRSRDIQSNERWFLSLLSSGQEIVKTNPTVDLTDGLDEVGSTQVIETELILTADANRIKAVHYGAYGGSFDDVGTSEVMFVNMDQSQGCLLVINKEADKLEAAPGGFITYTITVSNEGNQNCTGGGNYLFDVLPPQVSFVSETHTPNINIPYSSAYFSDGHYVMLNATSPLVPDEVAIAAITVKVKDDLPIDSCEGESGSDSNEAPDEDSGGDDIVNQVYVNNHEYGQRSIAVYSNSSVISCNTEPELPALSDTACEPSPKTATVNQEVTWTAVPPPSPVNYTYSWSGDNGLSGNTRIVKKSYSLPGTYRARVEATDISNHQCESTVVVINNPQNLFNITCEPSPKTATVNQEVTWTAVPPPSPLNYTYSWSGDNGLSGNTRIVKKSYSSPGIYRAKIDVVGVGNSHCESTVNVKISPNFQEI